MISPYGFYAVPSYIPQNSPKNTHLSLLCTNDLHGNLDNLAGLLSASKKMDSFSRMGNVDTLKISAGDNWSGADSKKNSLVNSLMGYMGYSISAIGNHELDAGIDAFVDQAKTSKTKFLAANLDIDPTNPMSGNIAKSEIKVINGTRYGLLGTVTPELGTVVSKKETLDGIGVQDEAKTLQSLQQEVMRLQSQGAERIILTSHSGLEFDKKIAQSVSGIDVIVSGHSHDVTNGIVPGQNYFTSPSGEPVLIVQTGENGRNFSMLNIEFDPFGRIVAATNSIEKTQPSQNAVLSYIKDSIVGVSPTLANISSIEPLKGNRRIEPCGWANLMCDSVRSELDVDIAFMNAANLRKVPLSGRLTERDIKETSPMQNRLLKTTMTEQEIVSALKNASRSLMQSDGYPGLLQVSGLSYKIDEKGTLLEAAFVGKDGTASPINIQNPSQRSYSVAYDSFMEDGREYPDFRLNGKKAQWLDYDKDTTIMNHIKKMPDEIKNNLKVPDDGRIQILKALSSQLSSSSTQNFLGLTLPRSA